MVFFFNHPVLFRQVPVYKLLKLSSFPRRAAEPHVDTLNAIVLMSEGWKILLNVQDIDKFTADVCCHSWQCWPRQLPTAHDPKHCFETPSDCNCKTCLAWSNKISKVNRRPKPCFCTQRYKMHKTLLHASKQQWAPHNKIYNTLCHWLLKVTSLMICL
jgi:hypothetical protein